jgi:hypothetical protein
MGLVEPADRGGNLCREEIRERYGAAKRVLAQLNYIPSVEGGAEATKTAASAMQKAGILDASTDLNALVDRTFVRLPTLDVSWVRSVKVEKEAKISCQQIRARAP